LVGAWVRIVDAEGAHSVEVSVPWDACAGTTIHDLVGVADRVAGTAETIDVGVAIARARDAGPRTHHELLQELAMYRNALLFNKFIGELDGNRGLCLVLL
jgi:hypothetical protein